MIPCEVVIKKKGRLFGRVKTIRRSFSIPESWEEVPFEKRADVTRYLIKHDYWGARVCLLKDFLELQDDELPYVNEFDLGEAIQYLEWMKMVPMTQPLLPYFKHSKSTYFCTAEKFADGTNLEFVKADEYYQKFSKGDDTALLKLTALLYRRKVIKPGVANRVLTRYPVDTDNLEILDQFQQELNDLPLEYQFMALWYWAGIKQYINQVYGKWLFVDQGEPTDSDEVDTEYQEKKQGVMFGWWGVFLDLSKTGVFGSYNSVLSTNFHTTCMYLVKESKEKRDRERKQLMQKERSG